MYNFIKKTHQIILPIDIQKTHLKEKNKHLAIQYTKHFLNVFCYPWCVRRNNKENFPQAFQGEWTLTFREAALQDAVVCWEAFFGYRTVSIKDHW